MSTTIRTSGRVAFPALIVIGVIASLIGLRFFAHASDPPRGANIQFQEPQPSFLIGPVDGLTSKWHWAPPVTSIPLGSFVEFYQPAPADANVVWTGADEVSRDDHGSTAVCWLLEAAPYVVRVEVMPAGNRPAIVYADGRPRSGEVLFTQCILNAVDIAIEEITVSPVEVRVDLVEIDESLPEQGLNEVTMDYFFGESIAALRDLGSGQYLTSVGRSLHMSVEVDPPGFAPLMEWRFDGESLEPQGERAPLDAFDGMGSSETKSFAEIGNHTIEVGPFFDPAAIEIETYSVTITSHVTNLDIVPEGEPVVFTAVTDPPGYEDDITWLSSTLYGTGVPVLGSGPTFTVQFDDTWGPHPDGSNWQWLGAKADNVAFGQDQKTCPDCPEGFQCVAEFEEFDPVEGVFFGFLGFSCELADPGGPAGECLVQLVFNVDGSVEVNCSQGDCMGTCQAVGIPGPPATGRCDCI